MKKLYASLSIIFCILLLLSCISCSKGAEADFFDSMKNNLSEEGIEMEDSASAESGGVELTEKTLTEGRKIIQNIEVYLQTKEFNPLLEKLEAEIKALGGYVEESTTHGMNPEQDQYQSAYLVVRIPAEKSGNFDAFLSENSVVTSRRVSTEDVTLQYVDMESRVKALTIEKEALEEILKNAVTVEDVITVRQQLTDVIYEIESYESKLRTYDNLVSYCTVTINISEVERTAVVEKQNTWQKIGTNLKNNFENVWKGSVAVFIFLVSAIPYLIPVAIFAVAFRLSFKIKKSKKKQNPDSKQ